MKKNSSLTEKLAHYSATHSILVIVAWVVVAVLGFYFSATTLFNNLDSGFSLIGDFESVKASQVLSDANINQATNTRESIVLRSKNGLSVSSEEFKAKEREVTQKAKEFMLERISEVSDSPNPQLEDITLEKLEDGVVPAPSVVDRLALQDLIDEEIEKREQEFEDRADNLEVYGEDLKQKAEDLQRQQAELQELLASGQISPQDAQEHGANLQQYGQDIKDAKETLDQAVDDLKEDADEAKVQGEKDRAEADEFIDKMVGEDNASVLILATFDRPVEEEISVKEWAEDIQSLSDDQFAVTSVGKATISEAFTVITEEDLIKAETLGLPVTFLVLILVFGALVASLAPLILGVIAIGTALGLTTIVGQFMELQLFVTNMISMLGLAVGIDYALFLTERYREEKRNGKTKLDAITRAAATSGKAVIFSGITVLVALMSIMFVPLNVYQSLSTGAVLVVSVSVIAVMTLLPALLSVMGDAIDWPRLRKPKPKMSKKDWIYSGFWGRLTKLSVTHPWAVMISSICILLAMAYPALQLKTGFVDLSDLPRGETAEAIDHMRDNWSQGQIFPVDIVATNEEDIQRLHELEDTVTDHELVDSVTPVIESEDGETGLLSLYLTVNQSTEAAYGFVDELRDGKVSPLVSDSMIIGGQSVGEHETTEMLKPTTPRSIAFVLSLSFILLMMAFRSVVVPIKAMIYNLLSVAATYGLMTLVFAHGWGLDILGYQPSPIIEAWLPIFLFAILFGLSMDYHVFILSRIREHYDVTGDNTESVALGIRSTARIITGAALIMVVVFTTFSFASARQMQQLGFGLAVAVFLDATIIRSLLVPSLMVLMKNVNWWLPSWLSWLPDIRIEGEPEEGHVEETGYLPTDSVN